MLGMMYVSLKKEVPSQFIDEPFRMNELVHYRYVDEGLDIWTGSKRLGHLRVGIIPTNEIESTVQFYPGYRTK